MRLIIAIISVAAIALKASCSNAAEIRELGVVGTDGGRIITVTGELVLGDERRFSNIAVQAKGAVVLFDSPGGSVPAAIQIGKAIRLEGFVTIVSEGNTCASACALAWLGGVVRYMGNSAKVGFHAAYINASGEKQVSSVANALIGGYLNGLGYSENAIAYFTSAPPEGVRWLTFGEAARLGIEVRNLADVQQTGATAAPKLAPKVDPTRPQNVCGWYAIHYCSKSYEVAASEARKFAGWVVNTNEPSYPKFAPGWFCSVLGPMAKQDADNIAAKAKDRGFPTAYIKNPC